MLNELINRFKKEDFKFFEATIEENKIFKNTKIASNKDNDEEPRLIIIYGDNASGKSLFANVIEEQCRKKDWGVRSNSMKNRTSSGYQKAFIFGDEHEQSTGVTSLKVTEKCLVATRDSKKNALAILDEPDIGLSPKYSRAFGLYIADQITKLKDNQHVVLISHSPDLISFTLNNANYKYFAIGINTNKTISEWINQKDVASIDELMDLKKIGNQKRCAIYSIYNK